MIRRTSPHYRAPRFFPSDSAQTETSPVVRNEGRSGAARRSRNRAPYRYSDEVLAGLTHGLHLVGRSREQAPAEQEGETFEAVYPRYPFAPLVRLGLGLAALLRRFPRR